MYLKRLLQTWLSIIGDSHPSCVTPQTVTVIQLRAPLLSSADERFVAAAMKKSRKDIVGKNQWQVFPGIADTDHRDAVFQRLRSCNRVLSFYSFFEDTVYLEACHHSMRCLLVSRGAYRRSFESAFYDNFEGHDEDFRSCYIQLWLYAMRHFPELSDLSASCPRKDNGALRPSRVGVVQSRQRAFSAFASSLGFRCLALESDALRQTLPDIEAAQQLPSTSTDLLDLPTKARCNRPFERSFRANRKFLFLSSIYADTTERLEFPTSFAVAKDLVQSFWGASFPLSSQLRNDGQPLSAAASGEDSSPLSALRTDAMSRDHVIDTGVADRSAPTEEDAEDMADVDMQTEVVTPAVAPIVQLQQLPTETQVTETTSTAVPIARKRKGPSFDDAEPSIVQLLTRAKMRLIGKPKSWCVIDRAGECRVGDDDEDLDKLLETEVTKEHALQVIQGSIWRTLIPKAAKIEARHEGSIFRVILKRSAAAQPHLPTDRQRRTLRLEPWPDIPVACPPGSSNNSTVVIEAVGDSSRELVLLDKEKVELGFIELHAYSSPMRSYKTCKFANDQLVVTMEKLVFECLDEDWYKLLRGHEEYMAQWQVDETFENL